MLSTQDLWNSCSFCRKWPSYWVGIVAFCVWLPTNLYSIRIHHFEMIMRFGVEHVFFSFHFSCFFSLVFHLPSSHSVCHTHTHIYANSKREFPWKPDAIEWDKRYFTIQIKLLQDLSKRKDRTEREYIWTENRIVLDDMEGRMIQTEVENFHALRETMWIIVLVCVVYACICMSYGLYHKKTPIHTRAHVILKLSKQWAYPLRIPPCLYVCVSVREHGCVHVIVCVKAESERNEEQREERRKKEIDVGKIGT